jgi:mono/diheme cytochrome c family protein
LVIPSMKPAEQMSIRYTLKFADGGDAVGEIINTVHKLGKHTDDAIAQYEETGAKTPENLMPGLVQVITQGGKTDHRVSRLAAQFNSSSDAVSDMLGGVKGGYTSTWSGYLVLDERKQVDFSFDGKGSVEMKLDGKVVLSEQGEFGTKTSGMMQVDPGAHELEIKYVGADDGSGHVRMMWKGSDFPKRSVASSFFKHQASEALTNAVALRHGRDLVVQQNCTKCHSADEELSFPELSHQGPDMKGIGSRVSETWLATWLASPHIVKPGTTMPAVVDGNTKEGRKDAADMAAYLASLMDEKSAPAVVVGDDVKQGGGHFHALGCVACHSLPDQPYDAKTERVALNRISQKYTQSSLTAFLIKPDKNHESIKMPDFGLSDDEARQLAAFIRAESEGKAPAGAEIQKGDAARGEKLIAAHNCASCHSNLPEGESKLPSFKSILGKSWSDHGCVTAKTPGKTPVLNVTDEERGAMEKFRSHYANDVGTTLKDASSYDFSERQLEELNCAACHQRDEMPSLLASLHSQSKYLTEGIPHDAAHEVDQSRPSLTYVGEMLHSDYMEKMLDGKLDIRPRPWLAMRMPAFHSRAKLLTAGLAGQHGMAPSKVNTANLDQEKIKAGKQLIGSTGGFACVICHADGDAKALAAFEVEGVNFDQVARRLRTGYYHQWMENPQSITPTTKMPRYTQDNKSPFPLYEGNADKQFDAMMEYLKSLESEKK